MDEKRENSLPEQTLDQSSELPQDSNEAMEELRAPQSAEREQTRTPPTGWHSSKQQQNSASEPPKGEKPVSPYSTSAWNNRTGVNVLGDKPSKKPFIADKCDGIFAVLFFVMSYLLLRWSVLWFGEGLRMTVFTLIYAGVVLSYAKGKKIVIRRESWFWLAVMLGCAVGYGLWGSLGAAGYWIIQLLFLLGTAVYWPMSLSGALFSGKMDNWMPVDLARGFFVLPFANFNCCPSAVSQNASKIRQGRTLLGILLGILISIPILGVVLPQLMSADIGFQNLIESFFENIAYYLRNFLLYGIFALPTSFYLYGLVSGCFHKRESEKKFESYEKNVASLRVLPMASVYTILGVICFVYLLFISVQAGYLFSAFRGSCPEGYSSYAEYARKGFFELCRLAAFNGAVLLAANSFSKKSCRAASALKGFNIALSLLTILLLTTAFSKMALYVNAYGLSLRRFLPCWFMIFLTICFFMIIVLQFRSFSIVRNIAAAGAAMFTVLCLINPTGIIARYNLNRFQEGTLSSFDAADELYDYELHGVSPALKLYQNTQDPELKSDIERYLHRMYMLAASDNTFWMDMTAQSVYVEAVLAPIDKELQNGSYYLH